MFLALANLVVIQYGRGAMRSALDQGVRVGAISGSAELCEAKMSEVLGQLLAGRMGDAVETRCQIGPGFVSASADAEFSSWTPLAGNFVVELSARAVLEPEP